MKPFNVRVYGLLEQQASVLVLREPFAGKDIYKFPGGGMEFGESTYDTLKREFQEELGLEIEVGEHIYTQDFFVASITDPTEQIIMIYYQVALISSQDLIQIKDPAIAAYHWVPLSAISLFPLSLKADQVMIKRYLAQQKLR